MESGPFPANPLITPEILVGKPNGSPKERFQLARTKIPPTTTIRRSIPRMIANIGFFLFSFVSTSTRYKHVCVT
jgi:hypothetical protein